MNSHIARRRTAAAIAALAVVASSVAVGGLATAANANEREAATSVDTTFLQDTFTIPEVPAIPYKAAVAPVAEVPDDPATPANEFKAAVPGSPEVLAVAAIPAKVFPVTSPIESVTYNRLNWLLQQDGQFAILVGSPTDANFKERVQAVDVQAKAAGVTKVYWFDPNLSGYTGLRNLDTRNPSGITSIAPAGQAVYGKVWTNLLASYFGNGYKATSPSSGTINVAADNTVVNDSTDPLWDYRTEGAAAAPIGAGDDVLFVYDKNNKSGTGETAKADKIVSAVNLSGATPTLPATWAAKITATLSAATGGAAGIDEIGPFKWWQYDNNRLLTSTPDEKRYGLEVLKDSDSANGWNVKQLTYPGLRHLLDLKGDDTNFAILFGGTWCPNTRAVIKDVNKQAIANNVTVYNFDTILDGSLIGGGNTGSNPLQSRNNAASGSTTNLVPSYIYGDLIRSYFKNVYTEYEPNFSSKVFYYPGGDTTKALDVVRKLQVPFLINYKHGTETSAASDSVKRQWIQQKIDPSTGFPTFKEYMSQYWFTNPSARLGLAYKAATVDADPKTYFPEALPIPTSVDAATNAPDSAYLTADELAAFDAAKELDVAKTRRGNVVRALNDLAFGQEALAALGTFFGGLPGGVVSTQTVTAPTVAYGAVPKVHLAIANKFGRVPAGAATLTVAGKAYSVDVAQNQASFTLPKLSPGSHSFSVKYTKDDAILGFEKTGKLTVTKSKGSKAAGSVVTTPTTKKAGKYKVSVTTPAGLAKASGKVTLTVKKGSVTKRYTGTVKNGVVTISVPKLKKGTWKVTVAYAGDAHYVAANATGKSIVVKK